MKCKDTKSEIAELKRKVAELEKRQPVTAMGILRFLVFMGSIGLVWLSWNALVWSWEWLGVTLPYDSQPQHLLIIGPLLLVYASVAAAAVSGCAWMKRGYDNLKGIDEEGIISVSIIGIISVISVIGIIGIIGGIIGGIIIISIIIISIGILDEFVEEFG